MRIALLSDVHGNPIALDAVLADARTLGVEEHWLLGDFVAIGPEPAAVLDRVTALDRAFCTRGNTDRYVVTGEGPPPDLATVRARPALIDTFANIAASFAWTRGYMTGTGWFEWLERLPLELRRDIGGLRILGVHAAPGTDDGEGVHPGRSDDELAALLAGSEADVVIVGHTHEPMARRVSSQLVINLGSVSNPRAPDLRASYVMLEASDAGVVFEHRRVPYDHVAFIESVRRSHHPAADFILKHQRGVMRARPPQADHTRIEPGHRIQVSGRSPV
jgi:putative phosphoesterase